MLYTMHVHAYDMLDMVRITCSLTEFGSSPSEPVFERGNWMTSFQGTGESRPERWTEDALVALIETL